MLFLLNIEEDASWITRDSLMVKEVIDYSKTSSKYILVNSDYFYADNKKKLKDKNDFPKEIENAIPIGSIDFVNNFLKIFCNLEREPSIEIPKVLQKSKYLNRHYQICKYDSLPEKGKYFVKDATKHKKFSACGEIDKIKSKIKKNLDIVNDIFSCSEIISNLSEYRVYVVRGKIINICLYKGKVEYYPDLSVLNNMIKDMKKDENLPKSYSIDVMVNKKSTSILEVHTFISLALYSTYWNKELLNGYIDGMQYIKNLY